MDKPHALGKCLLWSLPDELNLWIISQIDSHDDLCSLSVACRKLQGMTEPFIWRSLLVLNGHDAGTIVDAMRARPERTSAVHEFAVRYTEHDEEGIEELNPVLHQMKQLRHLTIESPCPNNHGAWMRGVTKFPNCTRIDYTTLFEEAVNTQLESPPLSMLQSVTLHGHRSSTEPFIFGRTAVIFQHPTLRHLTISCTNFDADVRRADISPEKLRSTRLETLKFIECNIYLSLLEVALSLPKALKTLEIGERLHAWDGCFPDSTKPRTSHRRFLSILQQQADSLETLVHVAGNPHFSTVQAQDIDGPDKLRSLTNVKFLELGIESPLILHLRHGGYPESLKTLRLNDSASSYQFGSGSHVLIYGISRIIDAAHNIVVKSTPKAINLELCLTAGKILIDGFDAWWSSENPVNIQNRFKIYRIACILKARGARFRILAQMFSGSENFIPPFMYGEELPYEEVMYDSDQFWMFSGQNYQRHDQELIPRELIAKCNLCREQKIICENNGYGTSCSRCEATDSACEYPLPSSPWVVNNVEWRPEQQVTSEGGGSLPS